MTNILNWLYVRIADVRENEEGQALVEYGLILAFIAVACTLAITTLGTEIEALLDGINF